MAKMLIVDDAAFMRMMLKDILTRCGHEIAAEASNGNEAVQKYKELSPDLVTMDITMPECDGLEGLSKIRQINDKAKVVMCSAMGQKAMVIDAIGRGAVDFIVKPFDPEKVMLAVNKALQG